MKNSEDQECLDAPELFGCLPLQPCVPPISTARREPLDMSNCSEVPPGESCEVRCVPPFVGAPSIASCPAENLILNQVLTMPVEPCVLGCKDPPVHPDIRRGEKTGDVTERIGSMARPMSFVSWMKAATR